MTTTSGALSHIKKAFEYIEHLSESNKALYSSTKRAISEMMMLCEDIIEIGASLVGEDSRNRESSNLNSEISAEALSYIEKRLESMEQMISKITDIEAVKTTSSTDFDRSSKSVNKNKKQSAKSDENAEWKRTKVSNIGETLEFVVKNVSDDIDINSLNKEFAVPANYSEETKELAPLIQRWYKTRFLDLDRVKSRFRYHVENIPVYIQAIVYDYLSTPQCSRKDWVSDFNTWIDSVKNNDVSVSDYALPFSTFQSYKELQSNCKLSKDFIYVFRELNNAGMRSLATIDINKFSIHALEKRCIDL